MKSVSLFTMFLFLLIFSCKRNDSQNLVEIEKKELAKGVRQDSIFWGIYLGMPEEEFYAYCQAMNQRGVFMQGGNMSVEYHFKDNKDFSLPTQMNFFPTFNNRKISEFPIHFAYENYEPWNPNQKTDKLLKEVKTLMEKWSGGSFFITLLPNSKPAYAQVVGNRRIVIDASKENDIIVTFKDLMVQ